MKKSPYLLTLLIGILTVILLLSGCSTGTKAKTAPEISSTRMTATAPSFSPEIEKAKADRIKLILDIAKMRAGEKGIDWDGEPETKEDPFKVK